MLPLKLLNNNHSLFKGAELDEFRRKERERNELLNAKAQVEDEASESEDEVKKTKHDIVVRSDEKNANSVPHFFKSSKKNPPMYPHFENKLVFDEYGEVIKPQDYVIAEAEDQEMTEVVEEPVEKFEEEVFS